jgi:hypothetical protein
MRHHTITATFSATADELFAYLADIDNLPEWATEFARELKLVDGRHKVGNGLGEFFFEINADPDSGVIDMRAGPARGCAPALPNAGRAARRRRQRLHLHHVPGARTARRAIRGPVPLTPARVRDARVAVRLGGSRGSGAHADRVRTV